MATKTIFDGFESPKSFQPTEMVKYSKNNKNSFYFFLNKFLGKIRENQYCCNFNLFIIQKYNYW